MQTTFAKAQFENAYGRNTNDGGNSVQLTPLDGGYIISGAINFGDDQNDVLLLKTNADGVLLWSRTYGGGNDEWGNSAKQTRNGEYIITGWTRSFDLPHWDVLLIRTLPNGDPIWTKTYGDAESGVDRGNVVDTTDDGGFIIGGWTQSFGAGLNDFYLIKTDENGDLLWTRTFGGTNNERGSTVQQTSDGGYIITGYTASFGAGDLDVYLIKTLANGDIDWSRAYGGTGTDNAPCVHQTMDGGYILAGQTNSFGSGGNDVLLIKTFANGDIDWARTYGGPGDDRGSSVKQTADSGYIIAGKTSSFGVQGFDAYLIRVNKVGNVEWTMTYGGAGEDWVEPVETTINGGYIIAGYTASYGSGNGDVYLIETDANGYIRNGCQNPVNTITTTPTLQITTPATLVDSGGTATNRTPTVGSGVTTTIICPVILPIELVNFFAACEGDNTITLRWQTASEINNNYFAVERSSDGINFEQIGVNVPGSGNSNTIHDYSLTDLQPLSGVSYYRLKQVDYSGEFTYSYIISAYCGEINIISVYGNPSAEGYIQYQIACSSGGDATVRVFNMLGQVVINLEQTIGAGLTINKVQTTGLSNGDYVLQITTRNIEMTQKQFIIGIRK
ncbi:MAG TPA: T9SS type A sorting domain-containing protein [Chitinophagales bacterium]|nr:T9SS type A sorting domain-containing protein [Chitinophagales bacterium]